MKLIERLRKQTAQAIREEELGKNSEFDGRIDIIIKNLMNNVQCTAKSGGYKWRVFEFYCDKKLFRKIPSPSTNTQVTDWRGAQRVIQAIKDLGLNHRLECGYSYGYDTYWWNLYVSWE